MTAPPGDPKGGGGAGGPNPPRQDAATAAIAGLYGKLPAHGDFVRRALPKSFVDPWDSWLQAGIAASREALGEAWDEAWRTGPAWRFALPAGACGPDAVAGVLVPSEDQVGRRFPLTLAAILPPGAPATEEAWFADLERLAAAGRAGKQDADALLAALPPPYATPVLDEVMAILSGADAAEPAGDDTVGDDGPAERPAFGWWTLGGGRLPAMVWELAALPAPGEFAMLLDVPA
jgi:type VI secretion system protein ImpM